MYNKTPFTEWLWENFGDFEIVEVTKLLNITQEKLGEYFTGINGPTVDFVVKIMYTLHLDTDKQLELFTAAAQTLEISPIEFYENVVTYLTNYAELLEDNSKLARKI